MKNAPLFLLLCGLCMPGALAQPFDKPSEQVLIPLYRSSPLPGANGSLWITELSVYNASEHPVEWSQGLFCGIPEGCPDALLPGKAFGQISLLTHALLPHQGSEAFLYLVNPGGPKVHLNLRVRDISRARTDAGTEIPVIREADALTGDTHLLNIPTDGSSRVTLRLYDFEGRHGPQVFVEVASPTGVILHSEVVTLLFGGAWTNERYPPYPSVAVVFGLEQIGIQNGTETVRVRLEPVEPGMRYWAFATVTNNETQHVTTITPQ